MLSDMSTTSETETDTNTGSELTTRAIVEAVLFATDAPLAGGKLAQIVGVGDARDMKKQIAELNELYEQNGQAFRIEEVAGGFQMLTLPEYNTWLTKLLRARNESKLSPAALETLAIVAYKQPVLRADIEGIRGVQCGETLNRLREMNLIKIVGRAEDLGRPMLYGTTKRFLEVFGLADLDGLPQVEQLKPPD
jgi:segregation and condensation protein B